MHHLPLLFSKLFRILFTNVRCGNCIVRIETSISWCSCCHSLLTLATKTNCWGQQLLILSFLRLNMVFVISELLLSILIVAIDVLELRLRSQLLLLVAKNACRVHGWALWLRNYCGIGFDSASVVVLLPTIQPLRCVGLVLSMPTASSSEQPLWDLSILSLLALWSAIGTLKMLSVAMALLVQRELPGLWWMTRCYVFLRQFGLWLEFDFVWCSTLLVLVSVTLQAVYLRDLLHWIRCHVQLQLGPKQTRRQVERRMCRCRVVQRLLCPL